MSSGSYRSYSSSSEDEQEQSTKIPVSSPNTPNAVVKKQTQTPSKHDVSMSLLSAVATTSLSDNFYSQPFETYEIPWKQVSLKVRMDEEECKHRWGQLIDEVRHFRTMSDIIGDLMGRLPNKTEIVKSNKLCEADTAKRSTKSSTSREMKKKGVNPDHPKKPAPTPYNIFCSQHYQSLGLKGPELYRALGQQWKSLTEQEKRKYFDKHAEGKTQYKNDVEEYARTHPDDEVIQKVLMAVRSTGAKKKSKRKNESIVNNQLKVEQETVEHSPVKKKKKAAKKLLTGLDMYFEVKYDDYMVEHPDLEEDDIKGKLRRKYEKLSDKKKVKYEEMADERNG